MFDFSYHMDFGAVLPAIATASVILLISGKIYNKIRVRFPVKVNCWFCNGNTSVPFNGSNSWYCPDCDQYNGFNADGGYNRPLAEQYSERLNWASFAVQTSSRAPRADNGLCRFCNINLQLKVRQLAQFVPLRPDNYDREVQQYSDRLERVYRLCGRCDVVLAKTLREKEKLVVGRGSPPPAVPTTQSPESPPLCWLRAALAMCALAAAVLPLSDWAEHLYLALLGLHLPLPHPALARLVAAAAPYVNRRHLLAVACLCQMASVMLARGRRGSLLVGLLVWCALLALDRFPLYAIVLVDSPRYMTVVQVLSAVFLLLLAVIRGRRQRLCTVSAVKPVRLHKLGPDSTGLARSDDKTATVPATCRPATPPVQKTSTESDLGLGRLSVGVGRPVTRSQTRNSHTFEARHYTSKGGGSHQLFKGLTPATLPPPPAGPLTRSSSLSSGFVSQPPSPSPSPPPSVVDHDALDSVSRCGLDLLPYHHGLTPFSRSPSPPFTVMHVTPPMAFGKFYAEMLRYETYVDRSLCKHEPSVLQKVQAFLTPVLFTVLIASNSLVLWMLFGEQYFKTRL